LPSQVTVVALLITLLNIPFGFWRAGLRKLSPWWFVAVHAPIPVAVGLRMSIGLGFQPKTLPIFVGAYFVGQVLGGRLRRWRDGGAPAGVTRRRGPSNDR
jgi:hypothetical protein